ncbi:hypothetical protein HGRIS_000938 [Hohenbuehelia grisea]
MFITAMAPEFTVVLAVQEWYKARYVARRYRKLGWTFIHAMFVQMDGFTVPSSPDPVSWYRAGQFDVHHIPVADIEDKSKSDVLAKSLLCLQLAWFILQFAARLQQRLHVTELELMTLAYAFLALMLSFFWWNKPFDAQQPIMLPGAPGDEEEDEDEHVCLVDDPDGGRKKVENAAFDLGFAIGGLAAAVFGALHIVAWNFTFPTHVEQLLWRISSAVLTAIALGLCALSYTSWTHPVVSVLFMGLYCIARLILAVEVFALLRSLPPKALQDVGWVKYLPHV